jgi:ubiquinone/menaquinone biosynthesis C-methylase UbiE
MNANTDPQREYHKTIFGFLGHREVAERFVSEVAEENMFSTALGFDQMGHFGPPGASRVAERIAAHKQKDLRILELGTGLGGVLRQVATKLVAAGCTLRLPIGIDVVADHLRLASKIGNVLNHASSYVAGDVAHLPFASGSLDAVFAAGSASHFADMTATLREAHRVLAPSGVFTMLEEVSLLRSGRSVPQEFRDFHPEGVFFVTSPEERRRQLEAAGFLDIELTDLVEWAVPLLRDRLKALKMFRGTAVYLSGESEVEAVRRTLETTLSAYEAGILMPAFVTANKP